MKPPIGVVPPEPGHEPASQRPRFSPRTRTYVRAAAAIVLIVGGVGMWIEPNWFFGLLLVAGVLAGAALQPSELPVRWFRSKS
jgi:hypothetical protein